MLVAAMNPTPCGGDSRSGQPIRSTPAQIQRYRSKISGPLLDRIDIHIEVPALTLKELRRTQEGESSASIRQRILQARQIQQERFAHTPIHANARMGQRDIKQHCHIQETDGLMLEHAMEELHLSARAYDRILRVARTIADLAAAPTIERHHLLEAIQYRSLDRSIFQ
jgi:magnesium chelatase family protein